MMRTATALMALLMATAAHGQTAQDVLRKVKRDSDIARMVSADKRLLEKNCILSSAERLPKIPGIVVNSARIVEPPPDAPRDPAIYTKVVEFAVNAVGQEATYRFICTADYTGRALVAPDGIR